MEQIICLVVGYAFGLIESGYLYGKMNGIDIPASSSGSGNSGTTNALRVLGERPVSLFIGVIFRDHDPLCRGAYPVQVTTPMGILCADTLTSLGVILGHNYPFI